MAYVRNRPPQQQRNAVRVRVQSSRGSLGILPLAAAAVPSVETILSNVTKSLFSIVDPGKKRDANRLARAEMWYQYALSGSVTAARRLHGGTHFQYTPTERQYYIDRWQKFQSANPTLAQQAISLGDLGIPEPGSDMAPPSLSAVDQQAIQAEINGYHQTASPAQKAINAAAMSGGLLGSPLVLAAALGYAILKKTGKI